MTGAALARADARTIPLADESVDLIITSPPYFALRSYRDGGDHYADQIGSEPTPTDFLLALWSVMDECARVLKPTGSLWVNLGDKYAGSGGHNNSGVSNTNGTGASTLGHHKGGGGPHAAKLQDIKATRRSAPDRYNQRTDVPTKSLMGLPWRFALGMTAPSTYRRPLDGRPCLYRKPAPDCPCSACSLARSPQWTLRAEVIWKKVNGLPESVTDRVRRSHEQWFQFSKSGRYFAGIDEVREPHVATVTGRDTSHWRQGPSGQNRGVVVGRLRDDGSPVGEFATSPLGKLPGSVRSIPSEPLRVPDDIGVDHFAAFPSEWPRWIIAGWSPRGICTACGEGRRAVVEKERGHVDYAKSEARAVERNAAANGRIAGGTLHSTLGHDVPATITGYACACRTPHARTRPPVILDPFCGTGTVPMMARAMGRYGIGLDLSRDYLRLARWRVFESGHGEKCLAKAAKVATNGATNGSQKVKGATNGQANGKAPEDGRRLATAALHAARARRQGIAGGPGVRIH